MKHDVSVAMATFNGERYIQQQLESIAQQTVAPAEIVICDDGSTDDTLSVIQRFSDKISIPVRIYKNNVRLGYVDNFLHAAGLCVSDVVAFCDQDDLWMRNKLELCLPTFDDDDVMLCFHNVMIVSASLDPIEKFDQTAGQAGIEGPASIWPGRYPWGLSQIFRRSLLDKAKGLRQPRGYHSVVRIGHDEWIAFLADIFGSKFKLDECLVKYRQHANNASGGRNSKGSLLAQIRRQDHQNLANIALSLEDQSKCLDEFQAICQPTARPLVARAAKRTASLADAFSKRASLHGSTNLSNRIRVLSSMTMEGLYGLKDPDRLPLRAFIRDLMITFAGPAPD